MVFVWSSLGMFLGAIVTIASQRTIASIGAVLVTCGPVVWPVHTLKMGQNASQTGRGCLGGPLPLPGGQKRAYGQF